MIRVGLSGWSYEEWVGPFYPVALRGRPEEWLDHYAQAFQSVEINSTFYAMPTLELVEDWARRGVALQEQGAFEYSVKLPRQVTHEALLAGDAEAARELVGRFDREVLDPLAGEGLLGAVLVQLAPRYRAHPDNVLLLQQALQALVERRVALEFRHPSWREGNHLTPLALPLFKNPDVTLAELDLPHLPPIAAPAPARHAYVRFHGRRVEYWKGQAASRAAHDGARYDYLYAPEELAPWVARVRELEARHHEVRVYFNNTPHAKGVANALDFRRMLGQSPNVPRPRLTQQTRLSV